MDIRIVLEDNTEYNLHDDLGWLVDFDTMPSPTIRTNYIEIPSRNGVLDLTEVDGQVYYEQLTFTLVCQRICRKAHDCLMYGRQMMNLFNGKEARVYVGEDEFEEQYYYDSRIQVTNYHREGLVLSVELEISAYPYRLAENPTTESFTLTGSQKSCIIHNAIMPVVPRVTSSATMTIVYEGVSYTISQGSNMLIPNLVFPSGNSELLITGTGTISFTYTKGAF